MLESSFIKAEALRLGFFRCGISKADRVNKETEEKYLEWIGRGLNASMNYLSKNIEKRLDPRILVPGVKSIISVAINYAPNIKFPENELHLSSYAIGTDYHLVVKDKLKNITANIKETISNWEKSGRICKLANNAFVSDYTFEELLAFSNLKICFFCMSFS